MTLSTPFFARADDAQSTPASLARDVARANTLARWLDTRFSFLGYRFGFETFINLLPVVGDTATAVLGLYPLWVAHRHRLGTALKARMAVNLLAEWLVGMIPVLGDVFDTVFKANVRNAALLELAATRSTRGG